MFLHDTVESLSTNLLVLNFPIRERKNTWACVARVENQALTSTQTNAPACRELPVHWAIGTSIKQVHKFVYNDNPGDGGGAEKAFAHSTKA